LAFAIIMQDVQSKQFKLYIAALPFSQLCLLPLGSKGGGGLANTQREPRFFADFAQ
jgi:hypothetical protein